MVRTTLKSFAVRPLRISTAWQTTSKFLKGLLSEGKKNVRQGRYIGGTAEGTVCERLTGLATTTLSRSIRNVRPIDSLNQFCWDDVKIVFANVDPIQIFIKQREKNVCLVEFPVAEPHRIENDRIVHVYRSSMSPDIRSRVVQ